MQLVGVLMTHTSPDSERCETGTKYSYTRSHSKEQMQQRVATVTRIVPVQVAVFVLVRKYLHSTCREY
jgi:hypothetical protein